MASQTSLAVTLKNDSKFLIRSRGQVAPGLTQWRSEQDPDAVIHMIAFDDSADQGQIDFFQDEHFPLITAQGKYGTAEDMLARLDMMTDRPRNEMPSDHSQPR